MASSSKTLMPCLALVILVSSCCEAREFVLGGKRSWEVPSSPDEFNKWAEKVRFEIGDSIVVNYDSKNDSVLEVSEENYNNCNKSNPIKSYSDGNTKITLDRSGPFFFISGAQGHCEKGEKLVVKVLSAKHSGYVPSSPAPSPVDDHNIALAPAPKKSGGSALKARFFGGAAVLGIMALFLISIMNC